jgi:hypothetical protein
MSLQVTDRNQRHIFGEMVKREWAERQWPAGRWVYSHPSERGAIIITTSCHAKDRMRHEVSHPLYKDFVVYDVAR